MLAVEVTALDVTEVTHSLEEGHLRVRGHPTGRQVAYASDRARLLSLGRNGPKSPARASVVRSRRCTALTSTPLSLFPAICA